MKTFLAYVYNLRMGVVTFSKTLPSFPQVPGDKKQQGRQSFFLFYGGFCRAKPPIFQGLA
jgi:hypothetical protein